MSSVAVVIAFGIGFRMVIRPEQMAAMDGAMQKRYHEELRTFLREHSPQLVAKLDDAALLSRIAPAAQKAREYGIRTGEGVLAYVGLAIAAGPGIHDDPKIRVFLEQDPGSPDAKVEWLYINVLESMQRMVETGVVPKFA
jgi:hypothetical protein